MLDLRPVTRAMAALVAGVRDDQLGDPTPCADLSLGDLLDHVDGLSLAFTMAAGKQVPEGGSRRPEPDGARLSGDWRASIGLALDRLAEAWARPAAWAGTTEVGGLVLPGEVAGLVAVDEVLVHGWDVACRFGLEFAPPGDLCATVLRRIFPWAPDEQVAIRPWPTLLWVNGRTALGDRPVLTSWGWWCRPLDEWDGRVVPTWDGNLRACPR